MDDVFARTRLLIGQEGLDRLAAARVAVFGVGGVGGYAVEALARSGVGALDLIDSDTVDVTNINRQIIATNDTVGLPKVQMAAARVAAINPACRVTTRQCFFLPETADRFDFRAYDYVVDAVDTVSAKLSLVEVAHEAGVPIISSMGAGNKLDPTAFRVADIYETSVDPLAKVMRKELRRRNIPALKVVYSTEPPRAPLCANGEERGATVASPTCADEITRAHACELSETNASTQRAENAKRPARPSTGSVAFVPSVAGLIIGGEVVRDLIGLQPTGGK